MQGGVPNNNLPWGIPSQAIQPGSKNKSFVRSSGSSKSAYGPSDGASSVGSSASYRLEKKAESVTATLGPSTSSLSEMERIAVEMKVRYCYL